MPDPSFRAIAVLRAKPGLEQALRDFTLDVAREIRSVDGLQTAPYLANERSHHMLKLLDVKDKAEHLKESFLNYFR